MISDLNADERLALLVAGGPGDDRTILDTEVLYALIGKGMIYKAGSSRYDLTEAGQQAYDELTRLPGKS